LNWKETEDISEEDVFRFRRASGCQVWFHNEYLAQM